MFHKRHILSHVPDPKCYQVPFWMHKQLMALVPTETMYLPFDLQPGWDECFLLGTCSGTAGAHFFFPLSVTREARQGKLYRPRWYQVTKRPFFVLLYRKIGCCIQLYQVPLWSSWEKAKNADMDTCCTFAGLELGIFGAKTVMRAGAQGAAARSAYLLF